MCLEKRDFFRAENGVVTDKYLIPLARDFLAVAYPSDFSILVGFYCVFKCIAVARF
jgi:hypothetical protein